MSVPTGELVAMVLHPNPVPLVQVSAEDAAEHDGIDRPLGVTAVSDPRTWFADSAGRNEYRIDEHVGGTPTPPPKRNCDVEHCVFSSDVGAVVVTGGTARATLTLRIIPSRTASKRIMMFSPAHRMLGLVDG